MRHPYCQPSRLRRVGVQEDAPALVRDGFAVAEREANAPHDIEGVVRVRTAECAPVFPDHAVRDHAVRRGPTPRGEVPPATVARLALNDGELEGDAAPGLIYGVGSGVGTDEGVPLVLGASGSAIPCVCRTHPKKLLRSSSRAAGSRLRIRWTGSPRQR